MTNPTKPLDIEARELLAKHYNSEGTAFELQMALNPLPTKCALAAISELLTRLREVEGEREQAIKTRDSQRKKRWVSAKAARSNADGIKVLKSQLSTSQALLEERRLELIKLEAVALEEVRNHGVSTIRGEYHSGYAAGLRRAASLIEELEGMG